MGQPELLSQDFLLHEDSHDDEKLEKKQRLLRNEFQTDGMWGIPLIRRQAIDLDQIEPWCYVKAKKDDKEYRHKTIHFFTYDWLYETVYTKPDVALEKLAQYHALLTPDFSCYFDMPLALQLHSTFKNRWCGAYWQSQGLNVIPAVGWGEAASFAFCFDRVEPGSVVAISTYCREEYKREFMLGYDRMLEVINPSAIICYGDLFAEMRGNVNAFSPFNHKELIAKLGMEEYTRRYLEGSLYPSN